MIGQKEVSDMTAILFMVSAQKLDCRNCEIIKRKVLF